MSTAMIFGIVTVILQLVNLGYAIATHHRDNVVPSRRKGRRRLDATPTSPKDGNR